MALNAATIWEVRTTGNAANGGGFYAARDSVNGVDYSQQDAAQLSLTDLYFTSGTTLKSDTGGFTHAMEGNLIKIASGTHFTAGYYEIVTYTDTNTVSLDRAPASEDTSDHKDGVGKVGGAASKVSDVSIATVGVVAGNTIWIKAGTYTDNVTIYADSTSVVTLFEGYNTTRGDAPTGTNRPVIQPSSGTCWNGRGSSSNRKCVFKHLIFSGSGGASTGYYMDGASSSYAAVLNCRARNLSGTGFNGGATYYMNCEADYNGGGGFYTTISAGWHSGYFNYSHNNTGQGFGATNQNNPGHHFSISESNGGHGFYGAAGNFGLIGSIAYNNSGGTTDGFNNIGGSQAITINCISVVNGRYGFNGSAHILFDYNLYPSSGTAVNSGGTLNGITAGTHDVSGAIALADLFTDAANGDFSLSASSPALNAGFPGTSMAGATV